MELRDYVRAVTGRWVWLVVGGILGVVVVAALGLFSSTAYRSDVLLYVGAGQVGAQDDDPGYAAQVQTVILPSIAQLPRSTMVTGEVVRSLGLPLSASELAGEVSVTTTLRVSGLQITVTDPDPARAQETATAVAGQVVERTRILYPGTRGSLLNVAVLGPATRPARVSGHVSRSTALLAGLAGAALAAVAAGMAELRRPRIRRVADVEAVIGGPALALPGASAHRRRARGFGRRRTPLPSRDQQLVVARAALRTWAGLLPARVAVLGERAAALTADLEPGGTPGTAAGTGIRLVPVTDDRQLRDAGPVDGVVLVVDAGSATRSQLRAAASVVGGTRMPVLGTVVDGLLPSGAGWRARLRAGVRGDGTWWPEVHGRAGKTSGTIGGAAPRRVAAAALVALGFFHILPFAMSSGLLAAVLLMPLWAPVIRRSTAGVALLAVACLALLSGLLLSALSMSEHGFELHTALRSGVLVLTAVCGAGLILWARTLLSLPAVGAAYGAGALLSGLLAAPGSPSPWKFELSVPVTIIALVLAARSRRPLPTVVTFAAVGAVDVLNDARSAFGFCVLGAVLVLWQTRASGRGRPAAGGSPRWMAFPLLGGLAVGAYLSLSNLMESGALGAQLQQRTLAQIAQSGSLLLSGRPEWAATWALMRHGPLGFGLGVLPNSSDEAVARAGLAVTRVPTVYSYLDHVLFDDGVQLHSIVADLWASTGPVGVLLGLLMGAVVVLGLGDRLARREASGLVCWLVPQVLWSLAFGPLSSDIPAVILALGLLLTARPPDGPGSGSGSGSGSGAGAAAAAAARSPGRPSGVLAGIG